MALTITSSLLAADGRTLTVSVGGIGTGPLLPSTDVTGFTVKVGGIATTAMATAGANTVSLFLSASAVSAASVTLDYSPGNLTDSAATPNVMTASAGNAVTNNSVQAAPNLTNIASANFASLPGLQAWYKSDTITGTDGRAIGTWADSSSNGHTLTQATSANQPILKTGVNGVNGVNALRFSGTQYAGQSIAVTSLMDGTYGQSVTVYTVNKTDASQDGRFVFDSGASHLSFNRRSAAFASNTKSQYIPANGFYGTTGVSVYSSGGVNFPYIDDDNFLSAQTLSYDGANTFVSSNTHIKSTNASGTITPSGAFSVGGRNAGDYFFNGLVSEVIICNQAHSATLRKAVEKALMVKYAIPLSKQIVHQGDSITVSCQYPDQMSQSIPLTYFNYDISFGGQGLAGAAITFSTKEATFYDSRRPRNILMVWLGTNDLTDTSTTADATNLYNTLVSYCRTARAAGFRVIPFTMTPRYAGTFEAQARPQFNALIRANWQTFADGLADVGNDATIGQTGQNPTSGSNTYYNDGVHINPTGGAIIAGYAAQAVNGGAIYAQNVVQPGVDNAVFGGKLSTGTPTQTGIPLTWLVATGGVGPYSYQVQRAADIAGTPGAYANVGSPGTSLSYLDSGLTAATAYWYQVQTTDSTSGTAIVNYSNMLTATTASVGSGLVSQTPSVTSITTTSLSIAWGAATGGTSPYTYALQRSLTSGGTYTNITGATSSPFADTGLAAATTYYYRLISTDSVTTSATSSVISATTLAALSAGAVTVGAVTGTTASLTSTVPVGGTAPYTYKWYRNTDHVSFIPAQVVAGATSATLNDTGLTINTLYYYVCQYADAASGTINSLEVQASTFVPATPAAPVLAAATTSLPISWNAVSGSTAYRVYRSGTKVYDGTSTTFTDVIALGASFSYVIVAVNGAGESVPTAAIASPTFSLRRIQ
jgi:hypothetical protein